MTEIQNLRTTTIDGVIQPKILQTQVPHLLGIRNKYNEFEHILKTISSPTPYALNEGRPETQSLPKPP